MSNDKTARRYTAGEMAVAIGKRLAGEIPLGPGSTWYDVVAEHGIELVSSSLLEIRPEHGIELVGSSLLEIRLENEQRFLIYVEHEAS